MLLTPAAITGSGRTPFVLDLTAGGPWALSVERLMSPTDHRHIPDLLARITGITSGSELVRPSSREGPCRRGPPLAVSGVMPIIGTRKGSPQPVPARSMSQDIVGTCLGGGPGPREPRRRLGGKDHQFGPVAILFVW